MGRSKFTKSKVANLYKNVESGVFYARYRLGVKNKPEKWDSLGTKVFSVAKLRVADVLAAARRRGLMAGKNLDSVETMLDLYDVWLGGLKGAESGIRDKRFAVKRVFSSWPGLAEMRVPFISGNMCEDWFERFKGTGTGFVPPGAKMEKEYKPPSPSSVNKTVDNFRALFDVGIEAGLIAVNPAAKLKRITLKRSEYDLPALVDFHRWVAEIRKGSGNKGCDAADLVEFMAYSGTHPKEVKMIFGRDVYLADSRIRIRGTKNKNRDRWIPILEDMRRLLVAIIERRGSLDPDERVMKVFSCQRSMDRARKVVGIKRLDHKSMRHFFCTRCVEAGVHFPTLANWLGHSDGGALLMKVYNHVRDEHSQEQAELVSFGKKDGCKIKKKAANVSE